MCKTFDEEQSVDEIIFGIELIANIVSRSDIERRSKNDSVLR